MQEKIQKALSGEITTEGFTVEELTEYRSAVADQAKAEERKVAGLREANREAQRKLEEKQAEAKRLEAENEARNNTPPTPGESDTKLDQFRQEQVGKAKAKLFSNVKVSDEERSKIEEKFTRLDSGKIDSDLIYEDLLSAVAAANPKAYFEAIGQKEAMERNAAQNLQNNASGGQAPPPGTEPKKFSDEAMKLSRDAGISPEAAERQLKEGMKRVIN